jgi:hypothetical protein
LFSFSTQGNVNLGTLEQEVDDSDIVRFIPSFPASLGPDTAGTFEWYFDGSDVDLTTDAEDIDALTVLSDGGLVVSTVGQPTVPGVSGGMDEDLLLFTPTDPAGVGDDSTVGTWSLYFDGSAVELDTSRSEDVNGTWIDPLTGDIYLTTKGAFTITGMSGDGADIFVCAPGSTAPTSSCTFRPDWDGAANGFGSEVVDAIEIEKGDQLAATLLTLQAVEHTGEGDDPLADPDEGADDVLEPDQQLLLPLMHR